MSSVFWKMGKLTIWHFKHFYVRLSAFFTQIYETCLQHISSLVAATWQWMAGFGCWSLDSSSRGPKWTTSLGQIAVCSKISPSRTPGTTRTTTWFWGASTALPWGSTSTTVGNTRVSHYALQVIHPARIPYLCPSRRLSLNLCQESTLIITVYLSRPGESSTPESLSDAPCTGTNGAYVI